MKQAIAYIDGFNLYFGLRSKGWKRFYWLNLQKVAQHLLKPDQTFGPPSTASPTPVPSVPLKPRHPLPHAICNYSR